MLFSKTLKVLTATALLSGACAGTSALPDPAIFDGSNEPPNTRGPFKTQGAEDGGQPGELGQTGSAGSGQIGTTGGGGSGEVVLPPGQAGQTGAAGAATEANRPGIGGGESEIDAAGEGIGRQVELPESIDRASIQAKQGERSSEAGIGGEAAQKGIEGARSKVPAGARAGTEDAVIGATQPASETATEENQQMQGAVGAQGSRRNTGAEEGSAIPTDI